LPARSHAVVGEIPPGFAGNRTIAVRTDRSRKRSPQPRINYSWKMDLKNRISLVPGPKNGVANFAGGACKELGAFGRQ